MGPRDITTIATAVRASGRGDAAQAQHLIDDGSKSAPVGPHRHS